MILRSPFIAVVLLAALKTVVRTQPAATTDIPSILVSRQLLDSQKIAVGDVVLDEGDRRVWVAEQEVDLSRREFDLLRSLMSSPGRVVTRARLYDDVWDFEVDISSNALDVHMSRLRRALAGSDSVTIHTLRGVGYRLQHHMP